MKKEIREALQFLLFDINFIANIEEGRIEAKKHFKVLEGNKLTLKQACEIYSGKIDSFIIDES